MGMHPLDSDFKKKSKKWTGYDCDVSFSILIIKLKFGIFSLIRNWHASKNAKEFEVILIWYIFTVKKLTCEA